jgi:hypothetical protein
MFTGFRQPAAVDLDILVCSHHRRVIGLLNLDILTPGSHSGARLSVFLFVPEFVAVVVIIIKNEGFTRDTWGLDFFSRERGEAIFLPPDDSASPRLLLFFLHP